MTTIIAFILSNRKLVLGGLVALVVAGMGIRINQLHKRSVRIAEKLEQTENELKVSKAVIFQYKKDIGQILDINKKYQKQSQELRDQERKLTETLNRERRNKKSLEQLSKEAPDKIESLINRKTAEVFLNFEEITQ